MIKTRQHLRVPIPMPARVKLTDEIDAEFHMTTILDISWGGAFVALNPPPKTGTRMVIQFLLSDAAVTLELQGTVVRSKTDNKGGPPGAGVQFDPLDDDLRSLIQNLIAEEILGLLRAVT